MDSVALASRHLIDPARSSGRSGAKPCTAPSARSQDNAQQKPARDKIVEEHQVKDAERVAWKPDPGPLRFDIPFVDAWQRTATEAERLGERGLAGLQTFQDVMTSDPSAPGRACATADQPQVEANGNPVADGEDFGAAKTRRRPIMLEHKR